MSDFLTRRRILRATGAVLATGAIAGCSGDGDSDEQTSFGIDEFVFCSEQPAGYGQYEEQSDATYATSDVVWIYIDVVGFDVEDAGDGQIAVDLAENLVVRDPNGEEILQNDFTFDNEFDEGLRGQFFVVNNVTLPSGSAAGEYEVEVSLDDGLSGESTNRTETFTVE
jgi:hypothetical protein